MILDDLNLMMEQADKDSPLLNLMTHSRNVAKYSLLIYDNLPEYEKKIWTDNWTESGRPIDRAFIYDAGMYHDIGKAFLVRFRSGLLDKERFTALDKLTVQEHTTAGVVLLQMLVGEKVENFPEAKTIRYRLLVDSCLYHHERTDGSGYLKSVHGSIPRIGELVAVADSFSAGTEVRCYSGCKGYEEVISELKESAYNQIYVNALEKGLHKLARKQGIITLDRGTQK